MLKCVILLTTQLQFACDLELNTALNKLEEIPAIALTWFEIKKKLQQVPSTSIRSSL